MGVAKVHDNLAFVTHRDMGEDTLHQLVPVTDARDVFPLMEIRWAGEAKVGLLVGHETGNDIRVGRASADKFVVTDDPEITILGNTHNNVFLG
jgi:hypothetical protein